MTMCNLAQSCLIWDENCWPSLLLFQHHSRPATSFTSIAFVNVNPRYSIKSERLSLGLYILHHRKYCFNILNILNTLDILNTSQHFSTFLNKRLSLYTSSATLFESINMSWSIQKKSSSAKACKTKECWEMLRNVEKCWEMLRNVEKCESIDK